MSMDGFLHHRRTFNCNMLILVLEGTLHITQSDLPLSVASGQYVFPKAGEKHYGHQPSNGKLAYLWVHFSSEARWETCPLNNNFTFPESYAYLLPEH